MGAEILRLVKLEAWLKPMQDHFGQSYCTNATLLSVELDRWVDWTTKKKKERKKERKKETGQQNLGLYSRTIPFVKSINGWTGQRERQKQTQKQRQRERKHKTSKS